MRTELEKMLSGGLYDPLDPDLVKRRIRARDLRQALNQTREADEAAPRKVLVELFEKGGDSAWIQPPFYCDTGPTCASASGCSSTSTASSSMSAR